MRGKNFPSPGEQAVARIGRVYECLLEGACSRTAPVPDIIGIKSNAKEICGYEPKLRGSHTNYADDHAVCTGYHPPLPELPPDENG